MFKDLDFFVVVVDKVLAVSTQGDDTGCSILNGQKYKKST